MKKSLLLFLFTIVSITSYSQTFTWHEVEACTQLSVTKIGSTFTPSVTNPNATGTNTNGNVSSLTAGSARIALPNPIMDTAGQSISLELLADVAGGVNTGSGRFQLQLQSLATGTITFVGMVYVTQGGTWEQKTFNLDGLANAPSGYEYLYVVAGIGYDSNTSNGTMFVDKIKGSVTQEPNSPTSGAAPALLSGNGWAYNHGSSNLVATPIYSTDSGGLIETNVANPETSDNASANVLKITRGEGSFESLLFDLPGSLDIAAGGTIKFRVYADYVLDPCNPIKVDVRLSLKSTEATDTNGNQGQKVGPAQVTIPPGVWQEVEVNVASFGAGQQATEYPSYDRLNVFMGFNDNSATPAPSAGAVYYFDAIQLPASATLSVKAVTLRSILKLYPNPVKNTFVLSKEVEAATIYDIMGRTVRQINTKQTQFDVSTLTKGMYFIEASVNNAKETIRFIKN
jgi:hypothetical protein